ncbi:MAG TPA: PIN domain-containing protein [Chloroflexota bacterium]|nr:PIN domain-containing protein [Chloroflexota bacterium]
MSTTALDTALEHVGRILLDTSALIAFHNGEEQTHYLAKHLLERIENTQDPLHGYYSVVSATEILVRPIRTGVVQFTFIHTFLTSFPNLNVLPVDLQVATAAATLRAIRNIRIPDALIIASGLLAGCEAIVTNDEQWQRRLAPIFHEFRWIHLGNFLTE